VLGGLSAVGFTLVIVRYGLYAKGILPITFSSQLILLLILLMGYELSRDVLRGAELARDLLESEQRLTLATNSANLALWEWDIAADDV
jgi:two-component system sensor kinase FixL